RPQILPPWPDQRFARHPRWKPFAPEGRGGIAGGRKHPGIRLHVLTALSIGAYYGMGSDIHNVDQRVAKIESTLQQLANVMVLTARQDERLIAIERRVDRLEE